MFRSNVFKDCYARSMKNPPTPLDVYNAVNAVVARRLAEQPLRLPSIAEIISQSWE